MDINVLKEYFKDRVDDIKLNQNGEILIVARSTTLNTNLRLDEPYLIAKIGYLIDFIIPLVFIKDKTELDLTFKVVNDKTNKYSSNYLLLHGTRYTKCVFDLNIDGKTTPFLIHHINFLRKFKNIIIGEKYLFQLASKEVLKKREIQSNIDGTFNVVGDNPTPALLANLVSSTRNLTNINSYINYDDNNVYWSQRPFDKPGMNKLYFGKHTFKEIT